MLQKKWYDKLKGFHDIEDTGRSQRPLKAWHSHIFQRITFEEIQEKYDYLERAHELLRCFNFSNSIHKRIWELHCEGYSSPEIEHEIKHLKGARKELTIRNIIKDLEREFE